ncbi:MAG: hypothetical protein LKJ06_07900 [Schleiferilactobacillus harbinensis]|jgi:hypothetical protein|nr:hypothetical protein [Schleiferilactobacillus harbinensis]
MNKRIKKKRGGAIINWRNAAQDPARAAEQASGLLWALSQTDDLISVLTATHAIELLYWRTYGGLDEVLDPINRARYEQLADLEVQHGA